MVGEARLRSLEMNDSIIQNTGKLYGKFWSAFDDDLFGESVHLFFKRF